MAVPIPKINGIIKNSTLDPIPKPASASVPNVPTNPVSTNIVRTLLERGWVRIIGHRDVPGKPALLGTTKEFLDYFSLKRLEDLPPLSDIKDFKGLNIELDFPEPTQQQSELIESKFNTHSSIENNENIGEGVSVNLEKTNSTS